MRCLSGWCRTRKPDDIAGLMCIFRHFRGTPLRHLSCRHPSSDFRAKIIRSTVLFRLQSRVAKNMQQFTQRQGPHMRRIAQYFPAILKSSPRGMFAAINIFYQHSTASAAHPSHPANHFHGLLRVMQSQAAHHNIELTFLEGQILRIASSKRNIFHTALFCSSTGNVQHCLRQIHSHNFARIFCKGLRDVPGPVAMSRTRSVPVSRAAETSRAMRCSSETHGLAANAVACVVNDSRTTSLCVDDI